MIQYTFKGALRGFGEGVQTQNCNIYNINVIVGAQDSVYSVSKIYRVCLFTFFAGIRNQPTKIFLFFPKLHSAPLN